MPNLDGYFVDWNGNLRSVSDPGEDFSCDVDNVSRYVAVTTPRGVLVHEATLFRTLEDIVKAGITAHLVPGSVSWGSPE
ncbi:hypothetical protein [Novosphingobium beihaiensis]|uniref:Uncharacterized protein n=1 Tax=Novosphingobium beihaiensis TaxID=2930389 RepID=A0ABT0BN71_9SPHN|nr:hypothetical protein [Novosphingobium beihaiensis]MCJ2186271.1 hypothetical protein [Novosphingobium beihaiensis]